MMLIGLKFKIGIRLTIVTGSSKILKISIIMVVVVKRIMLTLN